VAIEHKVYVHVPQAREQAHTFGRNYFGTRRNINLTNLTNFEDFFPFNNDDAIPEWMASVAVNEGAAHEGFQVFLLGKNANTAQEQQGSEE
jgi:hypothetical protein